MSAMTDVAFTDAVKAAQEKYGARDDARAYEEQGRPAEMTDDLARFIATRDSAYLATASADGRPYIQHRGGMPGFLRVLDGRTLGFADYPGNKQLITTGNLTENDRAFLFLMDYPNRQRVKLWGRAEIVEDTDFITQVKSDGLPFEVTRAIRFTVEAWDLNCRQFIKPRYTEADIKQATDKLSARIAELEAEVERLRAKADIA